jgi:hypothetical protein
MTITTTESNLKAGNLLFTPENTLKSQYEFATSNPAEFNHPAIIGGFGSGKTESIPLRWLSLIEWRAKFQKIKCGLMVVEPTKEMMRDILVETFNKFFQRNKIRTTYHKTYHNYSIRYKGYDFTAWFRSSDNPASLTGKTRTDIILDEFDKTKRIKDQKDIWNECISRIRGAEYGTVSPVTTPEGYRLTYEMYGKQIKKGFKVIKAKTYDNFFNPPDYVTNLYSQFSPELVKQYIEAEFINLTQGKIYYPFNRDLHLYKIELRKDLPVRLTFDFNVNPMTTSIGQTLSKEYCEILYKRNFQREVVAIWKAINIKDSNTDKQCREIKKIFAENNINNNLIIYGDASNPRSTTSNTTNWEIIKSHFPNAEYRVRHSNPARTDRYNAVNSKFLNYNREIGFIINGENCKDLIDDLEQCEYKEGKNEIDTSNPERTHNTDNVGYWIEYDYSLKGKITGNQF